jgi:hypothetical protein
MIIIFFSGIQFVWMKDNIICMTEWVQVSFISYMYSQTCFSDHLY